MRRRDFIGTGLAAALLGLAGSPAFAQAPAPLRPNDQNLITAAGRGDLAGVEAAIVRGARVDAADAAGTTALIAAAYGNHVAVAPPLNALGADVNRKDRSIQSAYLIATSEGREELLELTLAAGADVKSLDSYNGTGLIRAADRGHVGIVRRLLATSIDKDHVNRLGWTALLEAVTLGNGGPNHTEVVRLLVEAGANREIKDPAGKTALDIAREKKQAAIVRILEK